MEREQRIADIVEREWQMFRQVHNEGGRASCQDDRETFRIMRSSQFLTWDDDSLAAYRLDLQNAAHGGRNLLAEKYGYMMETTAPKAFQRLAGQLPALTPEKRNLIAEIGAVHREWAKACLQRYPHLMRQGRSISDSEAWEGETSSETYLRGELCTFSPETLRRYLAHIRRAQASGRNLCEEIMDNTVRAYGYGSAEEYERLAATHRRGGKEYD